MEKPTMKESTAIRAEVIEFGAGYGLHLCDGSRCDAWETINARTAGKYAP
jgi:hypothetical protein